MKTILVPTDFSDVAKNAIDYAVEIAKLTEAKIILFHVYHIPVITSDVPLVLPSLEEMETNCLEGLKNLSRNIQHKEGNKLQIDCKCRCGFAVEEINAFSRENKIDIIILGMQGAGYLTEKVMGSITTALLHEAKCPVLAIDKKVKFRSIKKMVLACDYLKTDNQSVLLPLKEFARLFKSHVYILNVVPELVTIPTISKAVAGINLEHALEDIDHSFHYAQHEDVIQGINKFVLKQNMDMVVMIPRRHSILKNIFKEPITKKMAFHTSVPILALHE
jgi:nucleotide-binding universal stress UspA family protein